MTSGVFVFGVKNDFVVNIALTFIIVGCKRSWNVIAECRPP